MKKKVFIGLSGGVDSAVSAALLLEQGYDVVAVFMKNWEDPVHAPPTKCSSQEDEEDAFQVAKHLKIPFYKLNFAQEYKAEVFERFLRELRLGLTPNPDLLCNREVKFKAFLNSCFRLGADFVATGHYARIQRKNNTYQLLRGVDSSKDQTYFLAQISKNVLSKVLFPIGELEKKKVREIAKNLDLPVAQKKDSVGICFIGPEEFSKFVGHFIPPQKGPFLLIDGTEVGIHNGHSQYTLGQRRGLGLGGPGPRWFVIGKDPDKNIVYVSRGDSPFLYTKKTHAQEAVWLIEPPKHAFRCTAKVRYQQKDSECEVSFDSEDQNKIWIDFLIEQRAVTPGQAIVFYQDDICIGSAWINDLRLLKKF